MNLPTWLVVGLVILAVLIVLGLAGIIDFNAGIHV